MPNALLSGVLPAVYSASDRMKRGLFGLLSDPSGWAESKAQTVATDINQARGLLSSSVDEDLARYRAGGPLLANQGQSNNRLAQALMDAYNVGGLTAYHGSPAKFSQFEREKIGSGRGLEQGWGVYLTDAERVAKENGPNVYKVDVPDHAVARMLAWQEPIAKQPKEVRKGVLSAVGKSAYKDSLRYGATGSDVYNGWLAGLSQQEASERLLHSGIPGIRYNGNGTTNTVVFDPTLATIVGR